LSIGAAVFLASLSCVPTGTAQSSGTGTVVAGEIQIPEISGAAFLPGDRLLVVADEGPTVLLLEQATQRLRTGTVKKEDFQTVVLDGMPKGANGKPRDLDDLEDMAWDRQSSVFLVTSHSRNRRGKGPDKKPERYAIVRMTLGSQGATPDKLSVFDLQVPPELRQAMERTSAQAGFNVEGAAWSQDGHLLLGLRSPTRTVDEDRKPNEDAIVLEVKDPSANPMKAAVMAALNLNGGGIRGMFYDPREHGLWILAGLSPDPPDDMVHARWALWFRHDDGTLGARELPKEAEALANAEAVTWVALGETQQPHLLLVEDGPEVSRYVLFPVPGK